MAKFLKPFSKPQHQNNFDNFLPQQELSFDFYQCNKGRNGLAAGSTSQKLAVTTLAGSNELSRLTASA